MNEITMLSTIKGSLLENFYPAGWDLAKIDRICSLPPEALEEPQPWWHSDFKPVACEGQDDFDMKMGYEIARTIRNAGEEGRELIMILPVGPMGMYKWAVYFLSDWDVSCKHVHGFNMDEWSDANGETVPPTQPGAFQGAMEHAFYGPLGHNTVPPGQRHFATKRDLPAYPEKIAALRKKGAMMAVVFGIGRACHIAFWEPHFAAEFSSEEEWKRQTHRVAAQLHPLTIEQNAITGFKGCYTSIPCFANTIGPGIFLQADRIIGGADGAWTNGMQWQGPSLWITLRYSPDPWVTCSYMPTLPGRLFYVKQLAGPLVAD